MFHIGHAWSGETNRIRRKKYFENEMYQLLGLRDFPAIKPISFLSYVRLTFHGDQNVLQNGCPTAQPSLRETYIGTILKTRIKQFNTRANPTWIIVGLHAVGFNLLHNGISSLEFIQNSSVYLYFSITSKFSVKISYYNKRPYWNHHLLLIRSLLKWWMFFQCLRC